MVMRVHHLGNSACPLGSPLNVTFFTVTEQSCQRSTEHMVDGCSLSILLYVCPGLTSVCGTLEAVKQCLKTSFAVARQIPCYTLCKQDSACYNWILRTPDACTHSLYIRCMQTLNYTAIMLPHFCKHDHAVSVLLLNLQAT